MPPIDWEKSVAIATEAGGDWGTIRVIEGDDREALKQEMTEKLSRFIDPETGEKVVKQIVSGEDLFSGPYQERMPDLLFQLSEIRADFTLHDRVIREEPTYHHRQEGILLGWGRGVERGVRLPPSEIVDMTPTVLYLLDLPVSEVLDGHIVEALLEPDHFIFREPRQIPDYPPIAVEWVGVSGPRGEVAEDVQETLRSLGYLQ